MQRKFLSILLLILLFPAYGKDRVTLASGEFSPYTSAQLSEGGFLNEILEAAFKLSGIEVDKIFLPWARGYAGTQKQHFDVTGPYIYSDDRAAVFLYSEPIYDLDITVFVRTEDEDKFHSPMILLGIHGVCLVFIRLTYCKVTWIKG